MTTEGLKWETTSILAASHIQFIFLLYQPATTMNRKLPSSLLTVMEKDRNCVLAKLVNGPKPTQRNQQTLQGSRGDDRAKRTASKGGSRPPGRLRR